MEEGGIIQPEKGAREKKDNEPLIRGGGELFRGEALGN